jgi:hypothetical protein
LHWLFGLSKEKKDLFMSYQSGIRSSTELLGNILGGTTESTQLADAFHQLKRDPKKVKKLLNLAGRHQLTPAIWVAIRDQELEGSLSAELREYFQSMYQLNKVRNELIVEQIQEICQKLNAAGIQPLLLKGAAGLVTGIYSDPALRVMRDIDVLIPDQKFDDAMRCLRENGWSDFVDKKDYFGKTTHHAPPLWKDTGAGVTVELHYRIAGRHYPSPLTNLELFNSSNVIEVGDSTALCLIPENRMLHQLIHATAGSGKHGRLRVDLHQLYETSVLCRGYSKDICWPEIIRYMEEVGLRKRTEVHLKTLEEVFSVQVGCQFSLSYYQRLLVALHCKMASTAFFERVWNWLRFCKANLRQLGLVK